MKTKTLLLFICISVLSFSQENNPLDRMSYCPKGSFPVLIKDSSKTISISSFYISNEITNKEFREFYEDVKLNPDSFFIKYKVKPRKDSVSQKVFYKIDTLFTKYSEALPTLINFDVIATVPQKENYFFNPIYDNYPVVGISFISANYYCLWLSKKYKNNKIHNYRVPTQAEWEYAASFANKNIPSNELLESKSGIKSEIGVYNLNSNVSEITGSHGKENNIRGFVVMGNSWKTKSDKIYTEVVEIETAKNYIGFRIIANEKK